MPLADYEEEQGGCFQGVFRSFVCIALTVLLGLQVYGYLWATSDGLDGDFSDVKYVVVQLTKGLSEIADYALESAGGRVIDTGDTVEHAIYESPVSYALHMMTSLFCRECHSARTILKPGTLPGECWAFKGTKGEVTIRLLGTVAVTGVSMEHIPVHISPTREISSAPRLFQLEGLEFRSDPYPHDFGSFEYDKDGKPIQYFEVHHPSAKGYNLVRVRVLTNWGHPVYTCVYRVRIHGDLIKSSSPRSTGDEDLRIENE